METSPLSAKGLAAHLGITVWSIDQVRNLSSDVLKVLSDPSDDSWSAFALRVGANHLVVYKPVSALGRENSVIMHEISHIVLGHSLAKAGLLSDGSLVPANYSQDQENEADWLAGTLLLPRPALLEYQRNKLTNQQTCEKYEVSLQMLTWRVRMTGVSYQIRKQG